ncbi:MAG: hypothetical protein HY821_15150 [Acidobacteria bacterium]|nr:hypothetical protein [Acidobacteriota bacterium]
MHRRHFFFTPSAALATVAAAQAQIPPALQNPDSVTNPPGLEYYLVGNGLIYAGIQSVSNPDTGSQAGVVLMSSAHLNRKFGSLLFQPSRSGLDLSRCAVWVAGKPFTPQPGAVVFSWRYPDGIPTVHLEWQAGPVLVSEDLYCPIGLPALVRGVTLENRSAQPVDARAVVTLRPNTLLMDEYDVDRPNPRIITRGYHRVELSASPGARALEREIEIPFPALAPAARASGYFTLTVDQPAETPLTPAVLQTARQSSVQYWSRFAQVRTGDPALDRLFRSASHIFRAVVAESGKMDGGPWGYNLEWPRDASMSTVASCMVGLPDIGDAMLQRIVSRMVNDQGAALDSSAHRPPELVELDQNGIILHALWSHYAWTGNDAILRRYWPRIRAIADFPLNPVFRDSSTGLVHNSREFWERHSAHGVLPGYELTYQVWNIAGWRKAAQLATLLNDAASARRWTEAANLMEESFLRHPRYSFIRDGRLVKRLLLNGDVQTTLNPPNRDSLPPGMPLRTDPVSYANPDSASVYPFLLGILDPQSPVALRTLEEMETLWNQRWTIGGFGRYNVTGEPDSPGPWPFGSLFITRAYLEAGNSAKVWRTLRWLASVPGGNSGATFEYYGPRPIPPLPPVAIIPWNCAELVTLVVQHLLGVRPDLEGVTIQPRLLDGLDHLSARLLLHNHTLTLNIRRGAQPAKPTRIPHLTRDTTLDITA